MKLAPQHQLSRNRYKAPIVRDLNSSLIPYAREISGISVRTARAAAFIKSSARRSLGFSKAYLADRLDRIPCEHGDARGTGGYQWCSLVEATAIYAYNKECVGEQLDVLLE